MSEIKKEKEDNEHNFRQANNELVLLRQQLLQAEKKVNDFRIILDDGASTSAGATAGSTSTTASTSNTASTSITAAAAIALNDEVDIYLTNGRGYVLRMVGKKEQRTYEVKKIK
jgi:hypothetical protein